MSKKKHNAPKNAAQSVSKSAAAQAAPAPAAEKPKIEVGGKFALTGEDAEAIRNGNQQLQSLYATLGERYESWRREEMTLLQAAEKARIEYTNTVKAAGDKSGLEIGKYKYNFDNNTATFTRVS